MSEKYNSLFGISASSIGQSLHSGSYILQTQDGAIKTAEQIKADFESTDDHMFGLLVRDPGYLYFGTKALRRDLYDITKELAEYAYENSTDALVFADRSARLGHVAFKEYWKLNHEDELEPEIFFLNPRGFRPSDTDTLDEHMKVTGASMHGDQLDNPKNRRTKEAILVDFKTTHSALMEYRQYNVLYFDTCVHTGDQALHVLNAFKDTGFSNVTFAVAAAVPIVPGASIEKTAKVTPDVVFAETEPVAHCWPFGKDKTVTKTYSSVIASRHGELAKNHEQNSALREEIRKVIREEFARENS